MSLRTFYRSPVLVFEAHENNRLVCPAAVVRRLRDLSALTLRRRRDAARLDRILRKHLGEELGGLRDAVVRECDAINRRVAEAEDWLDPDGASRPAVSAGGSRPEDGDRDDGRSGSSSSGGGSGGSSAPTAAPGGVVDAHGAVGRRRFGDIVAPAAGARAAHAVTIAQNDPPVFFTADFRGELVDTMFDTAYTWTFSFGAWYYRLKRALIVHPKWKRVFRLSQPESLSVPRELLLGVLNAVEQVTVDPAYDSAASDVEVAACLLAAYYMAAGRTDEQDRFATVEDVIRHMGRIMKPLCEDLNAEAMRDLGRGPPRGGLYAYGDPEDLRHYAPAGANRQYARGTFDSHAVVRVFARRGVFVALPGFGRDEDAAVAERVFGRAQDDLLLKWTRRLLAGRLGGGGVPVFVREQRYLRAGVTAVCSFLLLWKVLNTESVFEPRSGKFRLSDILGDPPQLGTAAAAAAGASEPGYAPGTVKNFEFVLQNYALPLYEMDKCVTVSRLFPGLVLACVADGFRGVREPDDVREDAFALRPSRTDPVLEYVCAQQSSRQGDAGRLEAHDALLFHYERGLSRVLSVALPRHRLFTVLSSLFNVGDIYESLYFVVLGFLPSTAAV